MSKQIKIDKERLDALKRRRDAAFSSVQASSEAIMAIYNERGLVISELSRLKSDVSQNARIMDSREFRAKISEMEARRDELSARLEEEQRKAEPIAERRQAIGSLYLRCAEFMGIDPRD